MSVKIKELTTMGQNIWLDFISYSLLNSGQLEDMIKNFGISGITSNPSIFLNALLTDSYYQNKLTKIKSESFTEEERYEEIVISDIKKACDIFLPLYNSSRYYLGYVSFEVSPLIATNLNLTILTATRLWSKIDRPNIMIKIPATEQGILAMEQLISLGINVNMTLLFSYDKVIKIWRSYINALDYRIKNNLSINKVKSVVSLFISRIDNEVDHLLPQYLQGKTAINLSKLLYNEYLNIFYSEYFNKLKSLGAMSQELLFASTSTKNLKYPNTLYVDQLIGTETVNTLPIKTIEYFNDHGVVSSTLKEQLAKAEMEFNQAKSYFNIEKVAMKLEQEGLALFINSYNGLIDLMR